MRNALRAVFVGLSVSLFGLLLCLLAGVAKAATVNSESVILMETGEQSLCIDIGAKGDYVVRRYFDNFEKSRRAGRTVVGDITYSCVNLNYLRDVHPGVLADIREKIQRGRTTFALKEKKSVRPQEIARNVIVALAIANEQDERDKRLHVMAGYLASEITNQAVRVALADSDLSPETVDWIASLSGFATGVVIGALKEAYDSQNRAHHTPDAKDFYKTSLGATIPLFYKEWTFWGL